MQPLRSALKPLSIPHKLTFSHRLHSCLSSRPCKPRFTFAHQKDSSKNPRIKARMSDKVLAATSEKRRQRALISVSDKEGLVELAKGLAGAGYDLVSTGGSAQVIEASGVHVTRVEDITGFPEMLDGRVKTLHPLVHGGILAKRSDAHHMQVVSEYKIPLVDVVVVNLYPFRSTVLADPQVDFGTAIENIDIGGPAMIRAAAKNHEDVLVVVDPADYNALLENAKGNVLDESSRKFRQRMAWKAFQHCASYDSQVSEYLWDQVGEGPAPEISVPMKLASTLRYGENPHQEAAFYNDQRLLSSGQGGVGGATQHHGKEMSYNNYLDADAAFRCVCDFDEPTCVIVKHTNPCGVASRDNLLDAYELAVKADPISAFGGIVAFNRSVDEKLAKHIREFRSPLDESARMFYEIVIAPGYTPEGLASIKGKSKTLRILESEPTQKGSTGIRQVASGFLHQEDDLLKPSAINFTCVSEAQPSESQLEDLKFAWSCVKHVKSNAIVVAKGKRMLGMGSGQPNRVKSVLIALEKGGEDCKGSVMASDAFFPFAFNDSVEFACKAGVTAIAHPGGSMRDQDAVDCCNKYGVVLMTTTVRHFRH